MGLCLALALLARLRTHSLADAIRLAVMAALAPADFEGNAHRQPRTDASHGSSE
jgi:hypothetical protein